MLAIPAHTEKELLLQSAEGSELAFAKLFHLHRNRLFTFLMRLTGSPEQTEDIIQDIFMKLWVQKEQLTGIEQFGSYLFRMGQNQVLNSFKRAAKETLILSQLKREVLGADQPVAQENLELIEVQKRLNDAVSKLPDQQKLIFQLSREAGLKHEEIAERLHLSPHTVRNHMALALKAIREHLRPFLHTTVAATCILSIVDTFQN